MENLKIVEAINEIENLSTYLNAFEYVAIDIETTGLSRRDEVIGISVCAEEDTAHYIILAKWNTRTNRLDYNSHLLDCTKRLLNQLKTKRLIGHNSVFDCSLIEAYFGISLISSMYVDTMILAHLLDENRRVGLKDLAYGMFGEDSVDEQAAMKTSIIANGGSVTKDAYELYKGDANLIAKYGAKDALLTFKLFKKLTPELKKQGLEDFFYKDESMPLLRGPTYDMNTTGLQVDYETLIQLKKTLEAECAEAKAYVYAEIDSKTKEKYPGTNKKNVFNIDAPQQLSWLLFGQYGLEFGTLTKGGKTLCRSLGMKLPYKPSAKREFIAMCLEDAGRVHELSGTVNGKIVREKKIKQPWAYVTADKTTLKKYSDKYSWIDRLLEYKKKKKLLTTYIKALEEKTKYGVISPSFLQHGTTSGRYSCKNPNFQNLPRDDKRIKSCVVARPGKVFVSADYSQLEPRVFSYYSRDPRLMNAFSNGTDFYSVTGIEVYDKHDALPIKEGHPNAFGVKYKKLRDDSKVIVLASAYGASAFRLAPTMKKTPDEAQEDMDKLFERFPGIKNMMLEAHELAKKNGYVTNLFGRKRRMPEALKITQIYGNEPHSELPYEARNILNLACNHRIQSTGASIVNRAMIALHSVFNGLGFDAKIVSQIHDEIVVECDEKIADDVKILLQDAMETTTILEGMPLEAIPRVTKTLAK